MITYILFISLKVTLFSVYQEVYVSLYVDFLVYVTDYLSSFLP